MHLKVIWKYLVPTIAVFIMSCGSPLAGQAVKASVASTNLDSTTVELWSHDLGYHKDQLYPLTFAATGCPFIQVEVSGIKLSLMFDTGTAQGFIITNGAPSVPYRIENRSKELNADGTYRGESSEIQVDSMMVLGKVFRNIAGTLSDWHMSSSEPFIGTVGLDFFKDRRVTLDYRSQRIGVSPSSILEKLDNKRYVFLELVRSPSSQGNILYTHAKVNGRDAIVYFDTGYNVSFIDPEFAEGLAKIERPGKFKIFREKVPVELGGHTFILNELREDPIHRGSGFDAPVALVLGSDVLSHFIITIDIQAKNLILGVPK